LKSPTQSCDPQNPGWITGPTTLHAIEIVIPATRAPIAVRKIPARALSDFRVGAKVRSIKTAPTPMTIHVERRPMCP